MPLGPHSCWLLWCSALGSLHWPSFGYGINLVLKWVTGLSLEITTFFWSGLYWHLTHLRLVATQEGQCSPVSKKLSSGTHHSPGRFWSKILELANLCIFHTSPALTLAFFSHPPQGYLPMLADGRVFMVWFLAPGSCHQQVLSISLLEQAAWINPWVSI